MSYFTRMRPPFRSPLAKRAGSHRPTRDYDEIRGESSEEARARLTRERAVTYSDNITGRPYKLSEHRMSDPFDQFADLLPEYLNKVLSNEPPARRALLTALVPEAVLALRIASTKGDVAVAKIIFDAVGLLKVSANRPRETGTVDPDEKTPAVGFSWGQ